MVQVTSLSNTTNVSGWMSFASIMMLVYGTLLIIAGFSGIFNSELYLRADQGQFLLFNNVFWGWAHLVLGVAFVVTGIGLIRKMNWALFVCAMLVMFAILCNLIIVSAYPGWSLLFLILDALLLYSLMIPGRRVKS